jgi:very-short-patch-repair endonuclease
MFRNSVLEEVTLKKNFQWGNMQTEYRDEQLLATEILKVLFPKDSYSIRQEEPVEECKAVLDIAIIPKSETLKRIAIRMMGEIHEGNRKKIKDEDQKTMLIQQGWRVYDFWKDRMPNLWNLEIEGAAREIRKELLF